VRERNEREKRGQIHFVITGVTGSELVIVVKIRLWWDPDFGPRASHLNFQPSTLRVPIVLGCRPVTLVDTKNMYFLYRLIKSADTKIKSLF
jgi:hypothetical protein